MTSNSVSELHTQHPESGDWLVGGGKMGQIIRSMDWSQTPLGPIDSWPSSLRTTVSLVLNSNFPISLAWGPGYTQIYNDGYWPICGDKHPRSMGQDFTECWASAFPAIGDAFRSALAGTTAFLEDQRMFLDRLGYLEETFFTFSFSPIRDEYGQVAGLFHPVTETTSKMVGQRRTRTLRDLAARGLGAQSLDDSLRLAAQTLADATLDLPFVLFYQINTDGRTARLAAQAGLAFGSLASPANVDLTLDAGWPLAQVAANGTAAQLDDVRERFGDLACGPYPEPITSAFVQAITPPGHERPLCIMVAGVSTRLPMNETYASFYELLAAAVTTVIANAIARQAERQRAEALAEIDRAKTVFFSNVSHEFRTPLTLLLGPLEDELAERVDALPPVRRERLETAHRNSLRLLRLVNTLLDFARIEAGRAEAVYEPTDLAGMTTDLAGNFRSACERAGLQLRVDCSPLPAPVYVDHDMWEKIVLNLLSNAFKFTLTGVITVSLTQLGEAVELAVCDTGVGIPADELPRIFDRFHRIRGTQGRTHEGTGIGLALVKELTTLHGGTIRAESVSGQGSTFTVAIPLGTAHLPADRIGANRSLDSTALGAGPFVEEALRWLPGPAIDDQPSTAGGALALDGGQWSAFGQPAQASATRQRLRIVWADDNADMRQYVQRLLSERYAVEAVADGIAALAAVHRQPTDLVLSDVMMPRLDGIGLLRELRADERTRSIPVILLSARAGEEARIEGLKAEADDYLIKPFSARELLARVGRQVELARLRREWSLELEQRVEERTAALAQTTKELQVEIAEHKEAEIALRRSELQYRLLFDTMIHGSVYQDLSGQIIAMNPAAERMLGRTKQELVGRTSKDLEHETLREDGSPFPAAEHPAMVALRTGQAVQNVVMGVFNPREQGYRWISVSAVPLFNQGAEKPYQVYTIFEDISDRKHAQEQLRYQADLLAQVSDAIISTDMSFTIKSWNAAAEALYGWPAQEVIGKPMREIVPTEYLDSDGRQVQATFLREGRWQGEVTQQLKDGSQRSILSSVSLIKDNTGASVGAVAVNRNITDRKQAEQALRRSTERLRVLANASRAFAEVGTEYEAMLALIVRTIAESLGDLCGIRMLSADGQWLTTVALYNAGVEPLDSAQTALATAPTPVNAIQPLQHILEGTRAQLLSELDLAQVLAVIPPENRLAIDWINDYARIAAPLRIGGLPIGILSVNRKRSGSLPFNEDDLSLVQDLADRAALAIGNARLLAQVQRELAERTKAEAEVRTLSAELERRVVARTAELTAANKELEAFSYSVSHDLRAPLRAIDGFSRILLEEYVADLPAEAQHYFQLVRSNAKQMGCLVDDLLTFARLSRQPLKKQLVDVAELVRQCLDDLRAEQEGRQIALSIGNLPACAGDPTLLKQVWSNLIGNALKYTRRREATRIAIGSRVQGAETIYFITDNGVGFDMRYSHKLFGVFQRLHRAEEYEGTGVGLAIVQRIITRHGGRIWAEAEQDCGATFSFTLGES